LPLRFATPGITCSHALDAEALTQELGLSARDPKTPPLRQFRKNTVALLSLF
jgi:hypothetical protein